MSYLSEYIIPGSVGKTFLIGNDFPLSYPSILKSLERMKGVQRVTLDDKKYPCEFTVWVDSTIAVKDIQAKVKEAGFHALPKSLLLL